MAGSFSDYLEGILLQLIWGNVSYSVPTTLYVALFTDSNTATQRDANTVTEVSGGSYARASVANGASNSNWTKSGTSPTQVVNAGAINFTTPTGSWGTVTAFGIYDAATVGNLLCWGDLTASQTISSGNTVSFAASALVITLD